MDSDKEQNKCQQNGAVNCVTSDFNPPFEKKRRLSHGVESETNLTDKDYFESYGSLETHELLLNDKVRTLAYLKALKASQKEIENCPVMDVGCGTGILSLFAWKCQAKPVFAVEASSIALVADNFIADNGAQNDIRVIRKVMEDVTEEDLFNMNAEGDGNGHKKVKAIVSEWMGHCLLYENMLPSVIYARDKWLHEDGLLFPCEAVLHIAAFSADEILTQRREMCQDLSDSYELHLSSLLGKLPSINKKKIHVMPVVMEDIVSKSADVIAYNLNHVTVEELQNATGEFYLPITGGMDTYGLCLWFHVKFPDESILSTGPYDPPTHWQQSIIFFENAPWKTRHGHALKGSLKLIPDLCPQRFLKLSLHCQMICETTNEMLHEIRSTYELSD